jgi:hypothetical protein
MTRAGPVESLTAMIPPLLVLELLGEMRELYASLASELTRKT